MARGIPTPGKDDAPQGGFLSDTRPLGAAPSPADVAAQQQVSEERHALEVQIEHRDRTAAEAAGMSYEAWLGLSANQRAKIIHDQAERAAKDDEATPLAKAIELTEDHRAKTNAQFMQLSRDLIPVEDKASHVLMCDPPVEAVVDGKVGKYHPGVSRITVRQMSQKAAQGFTVNPRFPFLPKPQMRCEMASVPVGSMIGAPCDYAGYTDQDVDLHMKYTHPEEYRLRAERLARQRDERQQALMELLVQNQTNRAA